MDPTGYNAKAQEMTRIHAAKPLAECIQDILGSSADHSSRPPPKHLTCPLTGQIFVEPVETPSGYAYERLAIELHLQTHETDPQSKEPLTIGELQDATALRKSADDFRAAQTKVKAWWFNH
ncbi:E3 ubiquitin-protein ligase LubX-like [Amphiura filiformis]|uniref:E3 ubiquitin-protein ligase LubX-like n=1 Tax=Amphiura filiformis TaxID=82378 RepID=UPI003B217548